MVLFAVSKKVSLVLSHLKTRLLQGRASKELFANFSKLLDYPQGVIFQQDGASPHFALSLRQYLKKTLRSRGLAGMMWSHGPDALQI